MCRHLAYVSPTDRPLSWALFDVPHSLRDQAEHPRHQQSGDSNPDGWGVAWYGHGNAVPDRHRTVTPIWDDDRFRACAPSIHAHAVVAAARLASPGATLVETGNAPFVSGPWSFSLNGYVRDFREGAGDELRARMTEHRRAELEGDTDSEVLFGLVLDRIDAGAEPWAALADVVHVVTSITKGRLNMLLTDGAALHATRYGNSLFRWRWLIASEPLDDRPDWEQLPDESVWTVAPGGGEGRSL